MKHLILVLFLLPLAWIAVPAHAQASPVDAVLMAIDGNGIDLAAVEPDQLTGTLTEGGPDNIEITFQIDRDVNEPVFLRIYEGFRVPTLQIAATGEVVTPNQCAIRLPGQPASATNEVTVALSTTADSQTVIVEAIDDVWNESFTEQACIFTVERTDGTISRIDAFAYLVNINDNDTNVIQTTPDMTDTRPALLEGNAVNVRYVFSDGLQTTVGDASSGNILQLRSMTPEVCGFQTPEGDLVTGIDRILPAGDGPNLIFNFNVLTTDVPADTDCTITAALTRLPEGYDLDSVTAIPDIRLTVLDVDADMNDDGLITPADAVFALNRLGVVGGPADVDRDGIITENDVNIIANRIGTTVLE